MNSANPKLSKLLNLIHEFKYYFIKDNPEVIEWLSISKNIEHFAKEYLSQEIYKKTTILAEYIVTGGLQRSFAITFLREYIGYKPKRPLMYLSLDHVKRLPEDTRDVVRYSGDYLDVIVKCIAKEKAPKPFYIPKSLGGNIFFLKGQLPCETLNILKKYDDFLYRPAKHDFNSMNKKHKFSVKEAVCSIFITMEISKELVKTSRLAQEYISDVNPNIWGEMAYNPKG